MNRKKSNIINFNNMREKYYNKDTKNNKQNTDDYFKENMKIWFDEFFDEMFSGSCLNPENRK